MKSTRLDATGVLALLVLIAGVPFFSDLYLLPRGILFVLLCGWLIYKGRRSILNRNVIPRYYLGIFLLFTGAELLSCAAAINPSEGFFTCLLDLSTFGLVITASGSAIERDAIFQSIRNASSIVIAIGFIQLSQVKSTNYQDLAFVTGLNANKNFFSGIIFLSLPFNILNLQKKTRSRFLSVFNVIAGVFFIAILQTRAVWLGSLLFFLVLLAGHLLFLRTDKKIFKKLVLYLSLGVAAVLLFIVFDRTAGSALSERMRFANYLKSESSVERMKVWKSTLTCIKEKPITGVGAGNWQYNYLKFGLHDLPSVQKRFTVFQAPHNDYLWVASEVGLAGFVLYLSILVLPLAISISALRKKGQEHKAEILILFSGLAGYSVYCFFDFPRYRVEHHLVLAMLLAGIFSYANQNHVLLPNKGYRAAVYALFSVSMIFLLYRVNGDYYSKKILEARKKKNDSLVIKYGNAGLSHFYQMDPTGIPLMWYMGHSYNNLRQQQNAYDCFVEAQKEAPYNFYVLGDLGAAEIVGGKYHEAEQHLKEAIRINDKYDEGYFNLSTLYFYKNDLRQSFFYAYLASPSERRVFFLRTISSKMR